MTKSQLRQLYSFVNLPYSENANDLDELKKILLLEFKSLGNLLFIDGKTWSKNDILEFFDSEIDSFDLDAFLRDYPWVRNLNSIDKIPYNSNLENSGFSDERFTLFAQNEGKIKEDEFLRTFRNRIIAQEDYYATALLLYRHCFSSTFQLKLIQEAKSLLFNRFHEIIVLGENQQGTKEQLRSKSRYITDRGFYKLMLATANDDSDLLYENLKVIYYIDSCYSQSTLLKIISEQMTLNHDENAIRYLNEIKDQINERVKEIEVFGANKKLKKKRKVRIYLVVLIIIIGLKLFTFIHRKYTEHQLMNDPEFMKLLNDDNYVDSIMNEHSIIPETNKIDYRKIAKEADSLLEIEQAKRPNQDLTLEETSRIVDSVFNAKKYKKL